MNPLVFERKVVTKGKGFFSYEEIYFIAERNGFTYGYVLSTGDYLRGAYIKTPDGYFMSFDMRNENNKFLDNIEVFKVWCNSHANGTKSNES